MNVGILGTGAVGSMLVGAHVRYGRADAHTVAVANRSPAGLQALAAAWPGVMTLSVEDLAATSDLFFACVPAGALPEIAHHVGRLLRPDAVFVCTASVASLADLAPLVPGPVVKVVPSIAHVAGRGVALVVAGPRCTPRDVEAVGAFLAPFSRPQVIEDAQTRAVTDVAACGPAVLAAFLALFAESAARRGASPGIAILQDVARETFCGVAALLDRDWSTQRIQSAVATPGGTTDAALAVVRARIPPVLDALHDATQRRESELRGDPPRT